MEERSYLCVFPRSFAAPDSRRIVVEYYFNGSPVSNGKVETTLDAAEITTLAVVLSEQNTTAGAAAN